MRDRIEKGRVMSQAHPGLSALMIRKNRDRDEGSSVTSEQGERVYLARQAALMKP